MVKDDTKPMISFIFPCKDEESTVGMCIDKAREVLMSYGHPYEIIVVDNASADSSARIAADHGALLVRQEKKGYGNALRKGLCKAKGDIRIICDCDMTYDIAETGKLLAPLMNGSCDAVIGNRFAGGIKKGAMPLMHILGVKFLSYIGRKRFNTWIYDFHCGFRGITGQALKKLRLRSPGMEFSTEFIAEASMRGLRITEVPVSLHKCAYERKSKLRTIRDGLRHLQYIIYVR